MRKPTRLSILLRVGEKIRSLRKAKGYSQEKFADAVKVERSYMGSIERGEHNAGIIIIMRIAKTLNVEVGELFPPIKEIKD